MYEVAPSILESRLLSSNNIVDAAVVGITDKENGQVPRAFVVLRPGFEETEENVTNLMESRLGVSLFWYDQCILVKMVFSRFIRFFKLVDHKILNFAAKVATNFRISLSSQTPRLSKTA